MKFKSVTSSLLTTLALALAVGACSKKKVAEEQESASDITSFEGENGAGAGTKIPERKAVYFEYDSFALTSSSKSNLEAAATWIKNNASINVQVEGHCDERGTTEYNLALGERRAGAVKDFLV